jgi:nucleotide-binding universal stress UspA family protein
MKRFSNILLVVDSDIDHTAPLKRALTLAKNNQAALTICAVVDAIPSEMQMSITIVTPSELCDTAVNETRNRLKGIIKNLTETDVSTEIKVLVGKPIVEIIRQVLGNSYDLVIKSAQSHTALKDAVFGNIDMDLMRMCPCPVWIIKPSEQPHYHRILAAVDQDPEDEIKNVLNQKILEISSSLALTEFSELHLVHAWKLFEDSDYKGPRRDETDAALSLEASSRRTWLNNLVNTYGTKPEKDALNYLKPQLHVVEGDAKQAVPDVALALRVDLIVMGTVARTGIPGFFMGNTAESILNKIDCSVLAIKPSRFVSPITL